MPKYTVEQARNLRRISQRDMADKLQLSENSFINKEKGKTRFYIDEAIRFSKIVDIPLEDIIFYSWCSKKTERCKGDD